MYFTNVYIVYFLYWNISPMKASLCVGFSHKIQNSVWNIVSAQKNNKNKYKYNKVDEYHSDFNSSKSNFVCICLFICITFKNVPKLH